MKEPLAFRMRPSTLKEVIGQEHILSQDSFLVNSVKTKTPFSIIFFGPPGYGKTTIAEAYAKELGLHIIKLNGTVCSKKELDATINEAHLFSPTVVIIDEIHRLNKDKQDYLLPYLESSLFYLIGATTANPEIYINRAIRSRCNLLEVKTLKNENIIEGIKRALTSEKGLNNEFKISNETINYISSLSSGDLRYAYNILEISSVSAYKTKEITLDLVKSNFLLNQSIDKEDDGHYDLVSALQKSIRGSDVDASLYYLAKLCVAKDLPSIERRLAIIAYEDVGLANPQAVDRVVNAVQVANEVGFPEAVIPLGFVVCDLALSPKSKKSCLAIQKAVEFASKQDIPIPNYLRLRPVGIPNDEKYDYDRLDLVEKIQYLPDLIKDLEFYTPGSSSKYEKMLNENYFRLKANKRTNDIKKLKKINQ